VVVGGFLVRPDIGDQLVHIFPRVVGSIVKALLMSDASDLGNGLDGVDGTLGVTEAETGSFSFFGSYGIVQWSRGIRLTRDKALRAEIQLSDDAQTLTVVFWGPDDKRSDLFFFQVSSGEMGESHVDINFRSKSHLIRLMLSCLALISHYNAI
jgi:hypothetical protein